MKTEILVCDCNSTEHQVVLYYEEDEVEIDSIVHKFPICYAHIHLTSHTFLRRLKNGIRYIFGRKSCYGDWDEFLFKPSDAEKLQELVNYLKTTIK